MAVKNSSGKAGKSLTKSNTAVFKAGDAVSKTPIVRSIARLKGPILSGKRRIFIDPVDGRSATAQRYKRIIVDLINQLGRHPSAGEAHLIRRAALFATWLEVQDVALAQDKDIPIKDIASGTRTLAMLLRQLGLDMPSISADGPVLTIDNYAEIIGDGDSDDA